MSPPTSCPSRIAWPWGSMSNRWRGQDLPTWTRSLHQQEAAHIRTVGDRDGRVSRRGVEDAAAGSGGGRRSRGGAGSFPGGKRASWIRVPAVAPVPVRVRAGHRPAPSPGGGRVCGCAGSRSPGLPGEFQMFAGVGRVKPVDDRADLRVEGAKHGTTRSRPRTLRTGSFNAPRLPRRLLHREVDDARGPGNRRRAMSGRSDPTR